MSMSLSDAFYKIVTTKIYILLQLQLILLLSYFHGIT